MSEHPTPLQQLTDRAALAGVDLDSRYQPDLAALMEQTLTPLRRLNPETLQTIEPAIGFDLSREPV